MEITLTLDDLKWNWLVSKAARDKVDPIDNIMLKVNEYLDACGRDIGQDEMTKIREALDDPAKLAVVKTALGM